MSRQNADQRSSNRNTQSRWFKEGLRFECTQCGNCCSGPSGWVEFTPGELQKMASHLNLLPYQFLEKYAHRQNGRWSLNEIKRTEDDFDCVFLKREKDTGKALCGIYSVRPTQCKTWPFWPRNLESADSWAKAAEDCPAIEAGIQGKGKQHTLDEILHKSQKSPVVD